MDQEKEICHETVALVEQEKPEGAEKEVVDETKEKEKDAEKEVADETKEKGKDNEKEAIDETKEKGKDAKSKFKEAFDNIHMPKMPKFSFLKKKTDTEEDKEEASDAVAVVTKDKNDVIVEEKSEAIANKQDANTTDIKATVEEEVIVEGETKVIAQDAKSIDTKSIVEEEAIQVSGADELQG